MHQPADIDGKLLSLRPRQQHAIVERVQKTFFRNPAFLLHQIVMHDGDLSGRAAKTEKAKFEPVEKGLNEANGGGWREECGHPGIIRVMARFGNPAQSSAGPSSISIPDSCRPGSLKPDYRQLYLSGTVVILRRESWPVPKPHVP